MSEKPTIRWLHLSDFHVGKDEFAQNRIFDKIHGHVRERIRAWGPPDLIFITGDLAQSGKAREYSIFYEEFFWPLLEILGDNWDGQIFTIPGNHDVDQSWNQAFSRDEILRPDQRYFDPTEEGRQKRALFFPRFEAYTSSETSHSPSGWLTSTEGAFAQHLTVRGCTLGISGVNTAWLCKDKEDRHRLTPGVYLVEAALSSVEDSEVRIVLGHHPLDWLNDEHEERLRAILGRHHAIYLHGHLHKGRGRREDGGGHGFLAIQAGACFQARDDDRWINGLLWGELDIQHSELRLQPRHWNPDKHDWPITSGAFPESRRREGSEWWHFPLPSSWQPTDGRRAESKAAEIPIHTVPKGWQLVDREFLDMRRKSIEDQEALRFFDGSVPTWSLALSSQIPRRSIVDSIADWLGRAREDRARVALLIGPGGEGKTTAFFQTVATLLEADPSWKILWRHDDSASITVGDLQRLSEGQRWLVATDDADLILQGIFTVVKSLQARNRGDFAFLLTCRDTDWRAAGGDTLPWSTYAAFERKELSGLIQEDAQRIIHAWSHYGSRGLGQLAGRGEKEAVQSLIEAATQEAELKEGAFFGAMLKVRIGHTLHEHVMTLLDRLKDREVYSGRTLLDAFAYIAAMHAEGLGFLSRPVLSQALGCEQGELKPKFIGPLGKEAAAVSAGQFILTRHRVIAQLSTDILANTFQIDLDELYVMLAKAAKDAAAHSYVPELAKWDYDLPRHFLDSGRQDLALRIASALVSRDPNNLRTRVHLAKMYRKAGAPGEAARLFREFPGALNRSAWFEWGVAEGESGNDLTAAWLEVLSLTDQAREALNNEGAKRSLAGLGVAFGRLFTNYNERVFNEARNAVAVLGLVLPLDTRTRSYFETHRREARSSGAADVDISTAFGKLEEAVRIFSELRGPKDPVAPDLPNTEELTFRSLRRLIDSRLQMTQES